MGELKSIHGGGEGGGGGGGGGVVRLFQGTFFYYFYFLGILLNDLELAVLEFKNIYKTQRTSLQSKIENGKHCREIGETP